MNLGGVLSPSGLAERRFAASGDGRECCLQVQELLLSVLDWQTCEFYWGWSRHVQDCLCCDRVSAFSLSRVRI